MDKVERALKKKEVKAKKWYHTQVLNDTNYFVFEEIHVFMAFFVLGLATGMAFVRVL